jgi:hypothetical protein
MSGESGESDTYDLFDMRCYRPLTDVCRLRWYYLLRGGEVHLATILNNVNIELKPYLVVESECRDLLTEISDVDG